MFIWLSLCTTVETSICAEQRNLTMTIPSKFSFLDKAESRWGSGVRGHAHLARHRRSVNINEGECWVIASGSEGALWYCSLISRLYFHIHSFLPLLLRGGSSIKIHFLVLICSIITAQPDFPELLNYRRMLSKHSHLSRGKRFTQPQKRLKLLSYCISFISTLPLFPD